MNRIYNFSSGPAAIDIKVLEQAKRDMLDCMGSGMSVLEMSHKSGVFGDIMARTSDLFRELLHLDDRYEILYISGGAYLQFSMVPMNLMVKYRHAEYINTDIWTEYAIAEAKKIGSVHVAASSKDRSFAYIPKLDLSKLESESDYLYLCINNTVKGTAFRPGKIPCGLKTPMVADMTSSIMSEEYDINSFGLVFAAAQKNLGPAGMCVVIADSDIIKKTDGENIPRAMCYKEYAANDSTFTTPSTFSLYLIMLTLEWVKSMGGVKAMEEINKRKAKLIYDVIDNSHLYKNNVSCEDRSIMNAVFTCGSEQCDMEFVRQARKKGLVNLKNTFEGKGLRAGLYNGVTLEAVEALADFMKYFELKGDKNV